MGTNELVTVKLLGPWLAQGKQLVSLGLLLSSQWMKT